MSPAFPRARCLAARCSWRSQAAWGVSPCCAPAWPATRSLHSSPPPRPACAASSSRGASQPHRGERARGAGGGGGGVHPVRDVHRAQPRRLGRLHGIIAGPARACRRARTACRGRALGGGGLAPGLLTRLRRSAPCLGSPPCPPPAAAAACRSRRRSSRSSRQPPPPRRTPPLAAPPRTGGLSPAGLPLGGVMLDVGRGASAPTPASRSPVRPARSRCRVAAAAAAPASACWCSWRGRGWWRLGPPNLA